MSTIEPAIPIGHLINQIRSYSSKSRLHKTARRFLPCLEGRILDIGAGKQPYRLYLRHDAEYLSMDVDEELSPDILGDVLDMNILPETFDSIICTEVLEHVPDPLKALHNINRALKKRGGSCTSRFL